MYLQDCSDILIHLQGINETSAAEIRKLLPGGSNIFRSVLFSNFHFFLLACFSFAVWLGFFFCFVFCCFVVAVVLILMSLSQC